MIQMWSLISHLCLSLMTTLFISKYFRGRMDGRMYVLLLIVLVWIICQIWWCGSSQSHPL